MGWVNSFISVVFYFLFVISLSSLLTIFHFLFLSCFIFVAILDIPDLMTDASLFTNQQASQFLVDSGAQYFKIIQTRRKLIRFFSSWDQLQQCCHTPQVWKGMPVDWIQYTLPSSRHVSFKRPKQALGPKGSGRNTLTAWTTIVWGFFLGFFFLFLYFL